MKKLNLIQMQTASTVNITQKAPDKAAEMKIVYIASPYSGDVERNVQMARQYCRYATRKWVIPLAVHLLFPQFLDDGKPDERALGCRMGLQMLLACDEMWVFGSSISRGMSAEITEAQRLGIKTRYIPFNETRALQEITL